MKLSKLDKIILKTYKRLQKYHKIWYSTPEFLGETKITICSDDLTIEAAYITSDKKYYGDSPNSFVYKSKTYKLTKRLQYEFDKKLRRNEKILIKFDFVIINPCDNLQNFNKNINNLVIFKNKE